MCDDHHWAWDEVPACTGMDSESGHIWIFDQARGCNQTTMKYYDPDQDEVIVDEEATETLNEQLLYYPALNGNNGAVINGFFFYTGYLTHIVFIDLSNFNLDAQEIIPQLDWSLDYLYGCTVYDTKRDFIYIMSGDSFISYDIINQDGEEHEGVLGYDYDEPSCAIANEDQYLYVIGGRTQAIERLDLSVYHSENTDSNNDDDESSSSSGDWEYIEFDWTEVYNVNTTGFCYLDGPETSEDGTTEAAYGISGATAVTVNEDYIMIFGGTCYAFDYYFGDDDIIYERDVIQTVVIYDTQKDRLYTSVDWGIPFARTRGKAVVSESTDYVYYIAGMSGATGAQENTIFTGDIRELKRTIMKSNNDSSGTAI